MYFSRVTIRKDHRSLQSLFTANGYAEHQLLWSLFPDRDDAKRPFLYRRERGQDGPVFYLVSDGAPQEDNPALRVEAKNYKPVIRKGELLQFKLRANPVLSRRDGHGKLHRHDVVMHAKRNGGYEGQSSPDIARNTGAYWLEKRAGAHGFSLSGGSLRADGYQQHRWFKGSHKKPIQLSTIDFEGILSIVDPGKFLKALHGGIGPAKAFGCGLLLIRRTS